ncbi:hypothetical protein HMN09_00838800 [Mycena chlorophos]|uniref:Haloacid dehalogenase n=1 Tax=Mycena chlorophos TaxID=658473 RepID=A0A8H6W7C5_MYCCL|nr:hypothetical protein HMN09_00838800 [Mycena chlorophos]
MAPNVKIHALIFDVFGTTVDWYSSVVAEVGRVAEQAGVGACTFRCATTRSDLDDDTDGDWGAFAKEWRAGYIRHVQAVGAGTADENLKGLSMDALHRKLLDGLLDSSAWNHLGQRVDEQGRANLNDVWHRLNGWPDAASAVTQLKQSTLVIALSNGNMRLLIDIAKHAGLPWDAVLSADLFGSFKPWVEVFYFGDDIDCGGSDTKVYVGALKHLSLAPENCAMVACHLWDLKGAKKAGMQTIYVRRKAEEPLGDEDIDGDAVQVGGEVDFVVDNFRELARLV